MKIYFPPERLAEVTNMLKCMGGEHRLYATTRLSPACAPCRMLHDATRLLAVSGNVSHETNAFFQAISTAIDTALNGLLTFTPVEKHTIILLCEEMGGGYQRLIPRLHTEGTAQPSQLLAQLLKAQADYVNQDTARRAAWHAHYMSCVRMLLNMAQVAPRDATTNALDDNR